MEGHTINFTIDVKKDRERAKAWFDRMMDSCILYMDEKGKVLYCSKHGKDCDYIKKQED